MKMKLYYNNLYANKYTFHQNIASLRYQKEYFQAIYINRWREPIKFGIGWMEDKDWFSAMIAWKLAKWILTFKVKKVSFQLKWH